MNTVLLQAGGGGTSQFIMLGAMVVIFYMFFIRPQQKKQKNQKNFINELKKGDMVVTMGGIHGKVTEVTDATITIDVDRGTKLTIEKSSVSLDASKRINEAK
ncbi:MAG: preprotein translocase subunit YajC [Cyclobacteriaceae bacterium]